MSETRWEDIPDENKWSGAWIVEAEVTPGTAEEKARCEAIYQASLKEKKS